MNELLLPFAVWMQVSVDEVGRRTREAWADRAREDGVDEAVTKMIWLAAGIVVALAATAFFTTKFNQAKTRVPDPLVP
ncbi:MAG: hypothetical protein RI900_3423 [Actinomycetota bacterium]